MNVTDLVAELLPIAESLFVLIDKIKTDAPDAWASVGQEYAAAVQAWEDAKNPTTLAPPITEPLAISIGEPVAPNIANIPPVLPHTLSTVEQTALGLPPANYTP